MLLALLLTLVVPCDVYPYRIAPQEDTGGQWYHASLDGPCDTDEVAWEGSPGLAVYVWKGDPQGHTVWVDGPPGWHQLTAARGNYMAVRDIWLYEALDQREAKVSHDVHLGSHRSSDILFGPARGQCAVE